MKFVLICAVSLMSVACGRHSETSALASEKSDFVSASLDSTTYRYDLEENDRYPIKPAVEVTPGEFCEKPSEFRYPEKIKYCNRDVDRELKVEIFIDYDKRFGYHTREMNRMDFKIDHLIPLCMGGSNEQSNLWPQHATVYKLTDPIEPFLCQKMAEGRLKQAEAAQIIREVKQDPATTDARMQELERR